MDPLMRRLIKLRLEDGRLPRGPVTEILDGPGNGRPCDACGGPLARHQKAVSGIVLEDWRSIQLHVDCFQVWDIERAEDLEHRE
jgi:hypothetical protein